MRLRRRGQVSTAPLGLLLSLALMIAGCSGPGRTRAATADQGRVGAAGGSAPTVRADVAGADTETRLIVNGESIDARSLWDGQWEDLAAQAQSLTPEGLRDYVQRRAAALLRDRITETLLYQHALLRLGQVQESQIEELLDAEIRRVVTTSYGGRASAYEQALRAKGLTVQQARHRLRREIIIHSFLDREIRPKVAEPTRAELLAAYEDAADSLRRPPRRRMALIDVRVSQRLSDGVDAPTRQQWEAARQEALSRARAARAELLSGSDFADVARRYCDGLQGPDGGDWGWVSAGSVRERFEPAVDALYALEEGRVSDIIETPESFFVVRCDEIDPGNEPTFESAQPQLVQQHYLAAFNRQVETLVRELRRTARIEPSEVSHFHAAAVSAGLELAAAGETP